MDCTRCLGKLSDQEFIIEQLEIQHLGINAPLNKEVFECQVCLHLRLIHDSDLVNIDSMLQRQKTYDGWRTITDERDKTVFLILSQIMYNKIEGQIQTDNEAYFDFPDDTDLIKILWEKGNAIGFYTVKKKESIVFDTMESYAMTTLDTAYIRKSHRRRGFGVSILEDIVHTFPHEDMALSTPISMSMYRVAEKFLKENPFYKTKLWEIKGVGSQGNRKLIFFTLKNLFHSRNI